MNLIEYKGQPAVLYNDGPNNYTQAVDIMPDHMKDKEGQSLIAYIGPDPKNPLVRTPLYGAEESDHNICSPAQTVLFSDGSILYVNTRLPLPHHDQLRITKVEFN